MTGALVTGPWEFEYRGRLLGGDTEFAWVDSNLASGPDVVSSDRDQLRRHGEHGGQDYLAGRTIELAFELHSPTGRSGFGEIVRQFKNVMAPGAEPSTLWSMSPAIADSAKVFTPRVSVRAIDVPTDMEFYQGLKIVRVMLRAPDPRFYADTLSQAVGITPANAVGGRPWPTVWPRQWGTVFNPGTFSAINNGNIETPVTHIINGPTTDPKIRHKVTGQYTQIVGPIPAGSSVVIDNAGRTPTVTLDGQNIYHRVDQGSEWFTLNPGANPLEFSSSDSLGSLSTRWRSAWV